MLTAVNTPLTTIVVTDCGSTTTKALLFERDHGTGAWSLVARAESPTTVEDPVADVTVGVRKAVQELEERLNRVLLDRSLPHLAFLPKHDATTGVDLYLSTSSAGGGLQVMVAGLVSTLSTHSAERAALGAGAIVLDALSADDSRSEAEQIERLRAVKPDIVLLTGGFDDGDVAQVARVAELLRVAQPQPRFGETLVMPVVYAGNKQAVATVREILGETAQVTVVSNVRPSFGVERIEPAREAIHELFLSHVMSHAPGYAALTKAAHRDVMPTPTAVAEMIRAFHEQSKAQVLCADIGGATTDVFSVCRDRQGNSLAHRTVSANLGMSYSIGNVLKSTGVANIQRWLPVKLSDERVRTIIKNKMIRPTVLPETLEELAVEQAVCREALRLSLLHHQQLATVTDTTAQKGIAGIFSQRDSTYSVVDTTTLDVVIGSGGALSHAPHRLQAALMMIDGFSLRGFCELFVDSVFMLPHLGVMHGADPEAALQVLHKDCLVRLAHGIIPFVSQLSQRCKPGTKIAQVSWNGKAVAEVIAGELCRVRREQLGERGVLQVEPLRRSINCGAGAGVALRREMQPHEHGIILDGRACGELVEGEAHVEQNRQAHVALGVVW